MSRILFTTRQERFIKAYYLTKSAKSIAEKLKVDPGVIRRFYERNGLIVPVELKNSFRAVSIKGRTSFTRKEDRYIKKNYLDLPVKTLAKNIGRSFTGVMGRINNLGLEIPIELIEARKKIGMYKAGEAPANKGKKQSDYMSEEGIQRTLATRFKKGQLPHNAFKKDGVVTIRHDTGSSSRPYKFIRLSLSKWYPLHQYKWENKYGKVPKGHCLWFKDGNSLNCTLKNLECITRAENALRNKMKFDSYPQELKDIIKLSNKLNNILKSKTT